MKAVIDDLKENKKVEAIFFEVPMRDTLMLVLMKEMNFIREEKTIPKTPSASWFIRFELEDKELEKRRATNSPQYFLW